MSSLIPTSFQICSLLRGGIAERGGVRVGHRIIEINGHSVVATQHEKIVGMLSNSIGEVSYQRVQSGATTRFPCVLASNEDHANTNVSSINWPGESDLHLEVFLIIFFFFSLDGARLLPSSHVQYSISNQFSVIRSLDAYIRTNIHTYICIYIDHRHM